MHDEIPDNRFLHYEVVSGDVDAAFRDADVVLRLETRNQRYCAVPLEGRAVAEAVQRLVVGVEQQWQRIVARGELHQQLVQVEAAQQRGLRPNDIACVVSTRQEASSGCLRMPRTICAVST